MVSIAASYKPPDSIQVFIIIPDSVKIIPDKFVLYKIKAFLRAVTHFQRDYTYRVNKNKGALTVQWV